MTLLADAAFWVSVATITIGAYRYSLSQAYRSKCSNFRMCWGLLEVKRNVEVEQHIDEQAMQMEEGARDHSDSVV